MASWNVSNDSTYYVGVRGIVRRHVATLHPRPSAPKRVRLGETHRRVPYARAIRWQPKVKTGGLLCGHDYAELFPGVVQAVNEVGGRPRQVFGDSSWVVSM